MMKLLFIVYNQQTIRPSMEFPLPNIFFYCSWARAAGSAGEPAGQGHQTQGVHHDGRRRASQGHVPHVQSGPTPERGHRGKHQSGNTCAVLKVHFHWMKTNTEANFLNLCHCLMYTLNWILYEPIWKQCCFRFRFPSVQTNPFTE